MRRIVHGVAAALAAAALLAGCRATPEPSATPEPALTVTPASPATPAGGAAATIDPQQAATDVAARFHEALLSGDAAALGLGTDSPVGNRPEAATFLTAAALTRRAPAIPAAPELAAGDRLSTTVTEAEIISSTAARQVVTTTGVSRVLTGGREHVDAVRYLTTTVVTGPAGTMLVDEWTITTGTGSPPPSALSDDPAWIGGTD